MSRSSSTRCQGPGCHEPATVGTLCEAHNAAYHELIGEDLATYPDAARWEAIRREEERLESGESQRTYEWI